MICCNERHLLPLKCLITFLEYIRRVRGASKSICGPLLVHSVSFLSKFTLKLHKSIRFGGASPHGKGVDILQGWASIATEVVQKLPWKYKVDGRSFWRTDSHSWITACNFCWGWLSNCTQNARFGVCAISAQEIGYCTVRKDIHWCWSIPYPSLYVWGGWREKVSVPNTP